MVAKESLNLNSVAERFNVSRPAISKHIKILTQCGLITIRQKGRERFCEATLEPLADVSNWLELDIIPTEIKAEVYEPAKAQINEEELNTEVQVEIDIEVQGEIKPEVKTEESNPYT
jgi:DNA-binding transcriptional ArsR family regulator